MADVRGSSNNACHLKQVCQCAIMCACVLVHMCVTKGGIMVLHCWSAVDAGPNAEPDTEPVTFVGQTQSHVVESLNLAGDHSPPTCCDRCIQCDQCRA
jgi:hypothetical protein